MNLLFIDVETTGRDHRKNGIVQMSGKVEIDGIVRDEFNFFVQPFPQYEIEDEALEVNGVTREQIPSFMTPQDAKERLCRILDRYVSPFNKLDKFHFVAYKATFDWEFMYQWFLDNDSRLTNYCWGAPIDVMTIAAFYLMDTRTDMNNFKQSAVAEALGIKIDLTKLHDSLYDVDLAHEIFCELGRLML